MMNIMSTDKMDKSELELEDPSGLDAPYFQILRKKKPLGFKIVWAVVTLAMLVFCVYIVYLLLVDFFNYPSYNKLTSYFTSKLTLPAISICSYCPLNRTAMNSAYLGNTSVYEIYSKLITQYGTGATTDDDSGTFADLDTNIYKLYPMDMSKMYVYNYSRFAKGEVDILASAKVRYTESGMCLEINDDSRYVQKVSGPTGGLDIVLDAKTTHYVHSVGSSGFQVFLRMKNETVLNSGWGFSVMPGEHAKVNLRSSIISRLGDKHGICTSSKSLYKPSESTPMTTKECFLTNILWYFIKEETCQCWPWYFFARCLLDEHKLTQRIRYSQTIEESLVKYWTETVIESDRLNISTNETCYASYHFNGTYIGEYSDIDNATVCAENCRSVENCVAFDYNVNYTETAQFGDVGKCALYDTTVLTGHYNIDGITNGLVNCTTQYKQCTVVQYELCSNKMIAALMRDEGPSTCEEPCNYVDYHYEISRSRFPSEQYWDHVMENDTVYHTWNDAKNNLVKISLYYETLIDHYNDQTASYEIQNFISEFGGVVDLFIGLSVFLIFQMIECGCIWLYYKCFTRAEDGNVAKNQDIELNGADSGHVIEKNKNAEQV